MSKIHPKYRNSSHLVPGEFLGEGIDYSRLPWGAIVTLIPKKGYYYDPEMKIKGKSRFRKTGDDDNPWETLNV